MKLFKLKVTYKDGSLAQPYTVYAESFSSAVKRIEERDAEMVLSILAQEVSESEAPWWGRTYSDPDDLAVQYHDVPWDPNH